MDCPHPALCGCYLLCHLDFAVSSFTGRNAEAKKRSFGLCCPIVLHDIPSIVIFGKFYFVDIKKDR